jgi:hypothetical protein
MPLEDVFERSHAVFIYSIRTDGNCHLPATRGRLIMACSSCRALHYCSP